MVSASTSDVDITSAAVSSNGWAVEACDAWAGQLFIEFTPPMTNSNANIVAKVREEKSRWRLQWTIPMRVTATTIATRITLQIVLKISGKLRVRLSFRDHSSGT